MKRLFAFLTVLGLLLALGCENVTDPSSEVVDQSENEAAEIAANLAKERAEIEIEQREHEEIMARYRVMLSKRTANATFQGSKITVPDDFATIQAAVNAAAPGTKIKIKEGFYDEQVTVMTADLRITAEGAVTVNRGFVISNTSGVELENMTIRRTVGNDDAVVVDNCSDITIQDNIIHGDSDGIRMDDTVESLIKGNTITTSFDEGIEFDSGCDDNVVEENIVDADDEGIELDGSDNNEIADNSFTSNDDEGIDLQNSNGNEIVDNMISDVNEEGIKLENADDNEISDNTITAPTLSGIRLFSNSVNNEISDNIIDNAGVDGIRLGNNADDNTVGPDNIVSNSVRDGLRVNGSADNNTVKKNTFCGSGGLDINDLSASTTLKDNETGACN